MQKDILRLAALSVRGAAIYGWLADPKKRSVPSKTDKSTSDLIAFEKNQDEAKWKTSMPMIHFAVEQGHKA
jgi:hypothetical protein